MGIKERLMSEHVIELTEYELLTGRHSGGNHFKRTRIMPGTRILSRYGLRSYREQVGARVSKRDIQTFVLLRSGLSQRPHLHASHGK